MRELTGNPDYLSLAESGELALRVSSAWPPSFQMLTIANLMV